MPILHNLFQTKEDKGTPSSSIQEANITLITNSTQKENHRPIFFMDMDVKILNKIQVNVIRQYVNKNRHHDNAGFIPGMQNCSNTQKSINVIHHINRLKKKNHDYNNSCMKSIWQNSIPIHDKKKPLSQLRELQLNKDHLQKT